MSKSIVVELSTMPLIEESLTLAISAVKLSANQANVSPSGFQIDGSFCDWGEIDTSGVLEVVDETASKFGDCATDSYNEIVDYLCEQITNQFTKLSDAEKSEPNNKPPEFTQDADIKETLLKNKQGYFLRIKFNVDLAGISNAVFYGSEDEFQKAFCGSNGLDFEEDGEQYIPEAFLDGESLYITGANTCTGEPEDTSISYEDAINNYEF